ncbi:SfiI-subtelomeric related protein family member [Corchorus olitorius]|uniref:SfiI-subtelomeric related protein family member n=1 Tax=Corchorus olitorius TaxID=93759 RepID=A0A1R3KA65_9ROSI|nr:SfiI-subtelomeric related protein family member [Corchorus olitorius]
MRKANERVVKKYSRSLKAESFNARTGRSPGSEGSPLRGGGVAFRNHVDSMVLRGKPVARALTYDEQSCEIISRFEGRVAGKTPLFQGGGSSDNKRRDGRLAGGYGVLGNARNGEAAEGSQMRQYVEGGGKNRGSGVPNIEESTSETPLAAETNLLGRKVTYSVTNSKIEAGTSGPVLRQNIPGVGLSVVGLGQGDVGHANVALKGKKVASKANESTGGPLQQGDNYGGNFKRSRETDMEIEARKEAVPGGNVAVFNGVEANPNDNETAEVAETHLCREK